jgi:hypothetical protein
MENEENIYAIGDQYRNLAYRYNDLATVARYGSQFSIPMRDIVDIETCGDLDTETSLIMDIIWGKENRTEFSEYLSLECSLDDILTKQKRGLKPYYQEKLEYKIEGSNDGVYIEYEPGTNLLPAQKIEWLLPKLIEKINSCYESKKQAYKDKKEADEKYLITLTEIEQAIENYKTKGHNFIL